MRDTVMVPAGELLPGDVLLDGTLVLRPAQQEGTPDERKTLVLRPDGKVAHDAYGFRFHLLRRARPGEE
jgi:hypothetical protein